jgi:dTDP-4-dehydrorhamnose reductase
MMKIIIGNGKVCDNIKEDGDVVLSHKDIEISNIDSVFKALSPFKNVPVVNTAAKINLEWCEDNKQECYDVNAKGALNAIEVCSDLKLKLVHISSGCIFDGNEKISTEDSTPTPATFYTECKTIGDDFIINHGYSNYLILRPRQLISKIPNPTNMITKFLRLAQLGDLNLIDEPNSLTSLQDFSIMIKHLIGTDQSGVFNCANVGVISPYQIGILLSEKFPYVKVNKISYEDFLKTIKVRRVNTILDISKLVNSGLTLKSAHQAAQDVIENYG